MNDDINLAKEDWELFDAYTEGALTSEEEKKLREDPLFDEKLKVYRQTISLVQERALMQKMQEWQSEIPQKMHRPVWKWYLYTAAASIVALMILGIWKWTAIGTGSLYKEFYRTDPGLATTMSVSEQYDFDEAMVDYKTGDYQKAIKKWEELYAFDPQNDTLNYFIGCALLARGNAQESVPYFERTTNRKDSYFMSDAYWYWGLALLKDGHKDKAAEKIQQSNHAAKQRLLEQLK